MAENQNLVQLSWTVNQLKLQKHLECVVMMLGRKSKKEFSLSRLKDGVTE